MADRLIPTVLGRSLRIEGGDLVLDAGKDLATVEGVANFLQGMTMIVETPFATDPFNVIYGFDILGSLAQPHSVRVVKEVIRLNLVKSLSADTRVRAVKDVVFDDDPRYAALIGGSGAVQHQKRNAVDAAALREDRKRRRSWRALVLLDLVPEGEVALRIEGESL